MVTVPLETPKTDPVLLTVAIEVLDDVHGVLLAAVPLPVRDSVPNLHTEVLPEMVGKLLTTAFAVIVQPLLLVYVMVAVPAAAPVNTPDEVMLAATVLLLTQGLVVAGVPDPVKVVVEPTQTSAEPEIVGKALMVMVSVLAQPLLFV